MVVKHSVNSDASDSLLESSYEVNTLLSATGWVCASQVEISVVLGEKETYKLRRCEKATIKAKGTSLNVKADISYENCSEEGPAFYQDCDYKGTQRTIGVGNYRLNSLKELGMSNDDLSSIKVPTGYKVEVFEHDHFQGKSLTLIRKDKCLVNDSFNDTISSIKVRMARTGSLINVQDGQCLSIENDDEGNGGDAVQMTCQTNNSKTLWLHSVSGKDNVYRIMFNHSGKCLGLVGGSAVEGTKAHQWNCNGYVTQEWELKSIGNNSYTVINQNSGLALTSQSSQVAGEMSVGEKVVQSAYTGASNQQWQLAEDL
jgi:hypothetical protein